jgi:hypothetical protein
MIEMFSEPQKPEGAIEDKTREERISICKSCPNLSGINICKLCGCFMPFKTWLSNQHCPDGKW